MSIDDRTIVDLIGTEKESGKIILTISDHLTWDDERAHIAALEEKLASYVDYVEGGQLKEQRPEATAAGIEIRLICQYGPTQEGRRFLVEASLALQARGLGFSWKTLPPPS